MNNIKTIRGYSESKFREKGSIFVGKAYPVMSEHEADNILNQIKKEYFDATHHCFAYKLFNGNIKYSDAGEPSGTAGIRILNGIEHYGLTNILVAVIRYFGGTKLGTGPLGRAYYNSALKAIESSQIQEKIPAKKIFIDSDLSFAKQVRKIISGMKAEIVSSRFDEKMRMECLADINIIDKLILSLKESTKNTCEIKIGEKITFI